MDIGKLSIGGNPPYGVNVLIETPMGGNPVKYEIDKASGAMFVDRFPHTAMYYPVNHAVIPHTPPDDGGPVDGGPVDGGFRPAPSSTPARRAWNKAPAPCRHTTWRPSRPRSRKSPGWRPCE